MIVIDIDVIPLFLLGLSVVACGARRYTPESLRPVLWLTLFVSAALSAWWVEQLSAPAVGVLGILTLSGWTYRRSNHPILRRISTLSAGVLTLLLGMHAVPGFNNLLIIHAAQISADGTPFTLYANFDKGAAGLLLWAYFCRDAPRPESTDPSDTSTSSVAITLLISVITALLVFGVALAMVFVRVDFKLPEFTPAYLAINLLFTCVSEEAFFRGLIQGRIASSLNPRAHSERPVPLLPLSPFSFRTWAPLLISTLLFTTVHAGGGPTFLLLTALASLGYGLAFQMTGRLEAAITVHFFINAVHFFGFTYPRLA